MRFYVRALWFRCYRRRVDLLTGLGSRMRVERDLGRALRHGPVAVLVFDVNGMRGIGDNYGPRAGDMALVEIASTLRAEAGVGGKPYRAGGDEFALILPGSDRPTAEAIAARVRAAVSRAKADLPGEKRQYDGFTVRSGIAVGDGTRSRRSARETARHLLRSARRDADVRGRRSA